MKRTGKTTNFDTQVYDSVLPWNSVCHVKVIYKHMKKKFLSRRKIPADWVVFIFFSIMIIISVFVILYKERTMLFFYNLMIVCGGIIIFGIWNFVFHECYVIEGDSIIINRGLSRKKISFSSVQKTDFFVDYPYQSLIGKQRAVQVIVLHCGRKQVKLVPEDFCSFSKCLLDLNSRIIPRKD